MERKEYDVVVVGAGPAGSTAAYSAVRNGASVLMIDRRKELGVPVQCGEALAEDVLNELKIKPDERWAVNKTNAVKIVSPGGIEVRLSEKAGGKIGYVLNRKIFDKYLAMRAVEAGAEIIVGTYVNSAIMENGKIVGVRGSGVSGNLEVKCKILVAADGVGSRVARWAGIKSVITPADVDTCAQFQMIGVKLESTRLLEFYLGNEIAPGGYAWVFPKGENYANVGIGVQASRAKKPPIEYLADFVRKMPNLARGKVLEINAGVVPICGPLKQTVKSNVIVVGDAARQVNPLTGGGIDSAMRAGNIAGEVAAKAIKEDNISERRLMEYEKRWREAFGGRLQKYLKAKEVFLSLSDEELDKLAAAVSKIDFDRISLTDLIKAVMRANPKLLFKLRDLF